VRIWGRIGTHGRELAEEFACEIEASQALEAVAQAKRRRGYRDLYFAEADVMERLEYG
jgi:predicted DNA-binding WGR domain protein